MSKPSSSLVHLSILIVTLFVAEIHGSKQIKALNKLQKSKYSTNSQIDTSHFKIHENIALDPMVHSQDGMKEKDKIEKLPGQPNVKFSQYGGYVTIDKIAGSAFYYYFVEAHHSKETLPLLLWLNGGPGCSSLAYGAMQEVGPFRVNSDGKTLYKNNYSWNYAANVLFLESPAGVGFSYSNKSSDYDTSGDRRTAADNYIFLMNWLERFPEYKNRDFYIAGESYAGHYVPQLAHNILHHNKKANRTIINLKGIMIGNAVINDDTDEQGMYDFLATHAIISDQTAYNIKKFCNFSSTSNQTTECSDAASEVDKNTLFLDIYNIYAPVCTNHSLTNRPKKVSDVLDPCSDDYIQAYFNRGDVQEALHANVTKLEHDWEACSTIISNWGDSPTTIIPLLHELLNNGLRVWIFSGDIDGRVPVTGTKYSLKKMKLPIETTWYPWFIKGEIGGYAEVYKGGLTFATVREAGHQVPSYQPARALSLIMHFLNGTPLPITQRLYN
ncbi:putative carboxypeptidase D [Medicago truncatula]|uniref:Carboxypeptidase n=1 Tax=Medicago truncatula TaxID=3880 RepID=G7IZJ6_MEDTR|nr:serine carboxypeptidase-like 40 [Medicago truncatula]AES69761.1 serine carboxypeptidase-like protein [Medicago truncatula]RHN66384.1 putative carboxypeptidase D [Medicago truncatula]